MNKGMKKLLIVSLCLWAVCAYGQEAKQGLIWSWDTFYGGLATKISELNLPKKYGVSVENIRLNEELNILTKRGEVIQYGSADASEPITGIHRLYQADGTKKLIVSHGDEIEVGNDATGAFTAILDVGTADNRWQFVSWHDLAIGGDGANQPIKTDGTNATYVGSAFCEDNGAGAGPDGEYNYKISFYTTSYEVLYAQVSNNVTVVDNDIDLSMIPIGPSAYLGETITGRKVYRSDDGGGGTYNLLSNGTIADNTTTILTDSDADAVVDANAAYPAGTETWKPPLGKLYLIHKNRLFIANNPTTPSRIYYSEDGSHDNFTSTSYFNIRANDGDEITFIKNLLGILTIGKNNTIQKLYTDGSIPSADWSISDPFSHIGCSALYSAINTPIGIIYMSIQGPGLYVFNAQHSTLLSDLVRPVLEDVSPSDVSSAWGILHNNLYMLSYKSKAGGSISNDYVLVYDILSKSFSQDILSINCFTVFNAGTDEGTLVAGSSTNGAVYAYALSSQEILHRLHSDFTGTFDDMRYLPDEVPLTGDSTSPVIELSWDLDIDNMVGTIDAASGIIDRPDTGGTYISQVLNTPGATAYDLLFWNEILSSSATTDVTLAIRSGATEAACLAAGFSSEFTDPTGSDISGETANDYTQYRITMSTDAIAYTPNVVRVGSYNVRITYSTLGSAVETSIALEWESGWSDMGYPLHDKMFRKFVALYEGTTGTLILEFKTWEGATDTFEINMDEYPNRYEAYFTDGGFQSSLMKLKITNNDLNSLKIKQVTVLYDLEPII